MASRAGRRRKPALMLDLAAPAKPTASTLARGMVDNNDADHINGNLSKHSSFYAGEDKFQAGDVLVDDSGLHIGTEHSNEPNVPAIRYEDLEEISELGTGASSTVKLVRHRATGELFALKAIGLYMKNMRDMLLAELRALFHSDCEALISFYGATYREGSVAAILEYMNLGGLDRIIKGCTKQFIPERILAHMTFQMLWGLGYLAHERRVHRDIKPQNILVNDRGQVKLTDFGISKELSTAVLARTFVGSFKYMSPERMSTMPYDYSSDIWSLGLVLLEAAMGKYPYPESSSTIGYVSIVMDGEVPLPPKDGTFSDEFVDFAAMCLEKDPSKRASAMELLDSEWLGMHGAHDLETCQAEVQEWLEKEKFRARYREGIDSEESKE